MKCIKRLLCLCLTAALLCTIEIPANAASIQNISQESIYTDTIEISNNSSISYFEKYNDETYYITENYSSSGIVSQIFKIENDKQTLISTITSTIVDDKVECCESSQNGTTENYEISAKITYEKQLAPSRAAARSKTYLRTEKYGISLVGKKVTISIAAAAITAVTAYVNLPTAISIITTAISAAGASGVNALPDYLYVTSKVYNSRSAGKIYTKYENKYYLNSARTQHIGDWTFSKRWGH